ncbi:putative capsid protein [Lake Sarah-associated circular molecule 12]|uniref:putative capsid protein n=1 Tax=Lake Sarah-associated circular molecule 12 TaxID=1809112 RepID=UPI000777D3A4|nr:putative capsid protein [Lake Sarah-associated circular molecule 12]ALE29738.1 putative capsid protein [Lake Sarah-associated circular molecule 12]ALE29739.1 putative capsid protein [Lake Sarah-associated circular molecule 12]
MPPGRKYRKKGSKPKRVLMPYTPARKYKKRGGRSTAGRLITTMAGLLTNSTWTQKARKLGFQARAMRAVGAPNIYHANFALPVVVPPGLQDFISFPTLQRTQLQAILSSVPQSSGLNRALIQSAQTELTFTNVTNAPVQVEMYDIMFRRDLSTDALVVNNGNNFTFATIEEMIKSGCQAANGIAPGGTDVSSYIGASAYDSQIFKDYCRVVKRQHVLLASGATHRHQSNIGINKIIDESVGANEDLIYVKGYTYATLILTRGVGAFDATASVPNSTTNGAFLNFVTSVRIKYTWVADTTNSVYYHNLPLHTGVPNVRNTGSGAYESETP